MRDFNGQLDAYLTRDRYAADCSCSACGGELTADDGELCAKCEAEGNEGAPVPADTACAATCATECSCRECVYEREHYLETAASLPSSPRQRDAVLRTVCWLARERRA